MLPRLYPLRGLPRQGQLWSWISFDIANQSFTLLINTLLFPIFLKHVVIGSNQAGASGGSGGIGGDTLWSLFAAVSMVLVVIASPIAGAMADERAWKKEALVITGFSCAILTCLLGLIQPGQIWLAALLYIPANFMFSIGENFLASFLPELSPRESFGKLSGFSWGCAYAAALLLLAATAGAMIFLNLKEPSSWRPFLVGAGIWFVLFAIPTLLFLREKATLASSAPRQPILRLAFARLRESISRIPRFRDLARLLVASLLYGAGMNVIIFFASTLANDFGFSNEKLVIFVGVITVSGIIGTLGPTFLQDRIGHKRTTIILLLIWLATALAFATFAFAKARNPAIPIWPLWVFGNLIGFGLGSLGAANRAFVGFLTPQSRTAQVFGLWGMVFKASTILTIPFALVKDAWGAGPSLLVLAGFILAGLLITLSIDEHRGLAAAREADADSPSPPSPA